jgi:hypothetical protein
MHLLTPPARAKGKEKLASAEAYGDQERTYTEQSGLLASESYLETATLLIAGKHGQHRQLTEGIYWQKKTSERINHLAERSY